MALRAYLDCSGTIRDEYLTLAGFAGSAEVWQEFEKQWKDILAQHTPQATYIHMREVAQQVKGFARRKGWTPDTAFGLVNKCLMFMQHLDKQRFRMFYSVVDLKAWKTLRQESYQIPEPVELCNMFCSQAILRWYLESYPDHLEFVEYFFDHGEPFKELFEKDWYEAKQRAEEIKDISPWSIITEMKSVSMKDTPGIQAADILAWAVNREHTKSEGSAGKFLVQIMKNIIPSMFVVWDEQNLRKHFKPLLYVPRGIISL